MLSPKSQTIIILLIIAGGILFSAAMMREGQGWGDDYAQYIHHAKNIAEVKPYSETGYIFNELAPTYAPQNYPPGFPLILAPFYSIWGINFTVFHFVLIAFFGWMLWLIYVSLKDRLRFESLAFILIILAFSPGFWGVTDDVVSDLPAACFALLYFYVLRKRYKLSAWQFIIFSGVVAWFSFACRATGLLLIPAAFIAAFIHTKKFDKHLLISGSVFLFFVMMQLLILQSDTGYFRMMQLAYGNKSNLLNTIAGMSNAYFHSLTELTYFGGGNNTNLNELFTRFLFVLFIVGFYLRWRKDVNVAEVFFLLYFIVLSIFPGYQGFRYLLPVLPFYLFYIFYTLESLPKKLAVLFSVLLFIAFTFFYIDFYKTIPGKWDQYRLPTAQSTEVFEFIKTEIPSNAIIMSNKPRLISLYTGIRSTVYPDNKSSEKYIVNQEELGVDYILTSFIDKYSYPKTLADQDTARYKKVFFNEQFVVYRITRPTPGP